MTIGKSNPPRLSILIPSIPSRLGMASDLYTKLLAMVGSRSVEILMLTDNKRMSIGEKHNKLMDAASGKYFLFCHDDDNFASINQIYKACELDVDVITYNARCLNNDGTPFKVTQRLGNSVEHNTEDGKYLDCNRPPFPNCAWAFRFRQFRFPDISYGEDWIWVEQCLSVARTEHHINKTLFHYNFRPYITEASTKSNEYWTNPNHEQ